MINTISVKFGKSHEVEKMSRKIKSPNCHMKKKKKEISCFSKLFYK